MKISPFAFVKISFLIIILGFFFIQCKKDVTTTTKTNPVQPNPLAFTKAEIDTVRKADSATAMRILIIFVHPDSLILRTPSKDVIVGDTLIKRLTDRMYTAVKHANGVGIAAPQVGICRKIIWVQRYDKGTLTNKPFEVYLNPKITAYSDTVVRRMDGCLSVPQTTGYPVVIDSSYRAIWVDVEYTLPNGTFIHERVKQWYTAQIFQHEIDHLYGKMYFDNYVSKHKNRFTILSANNKEEKEIGIPKDRMNNM